MDDLTINYYNENAKDFAEGTVHADVSGLRKRFLEYVPEGGRILDFGCGSGRDTLAFIKEGYQVDAIDGSKELCKYATALTGIPVKCQRFEDFEEEDQYDGIWACSSLLHLKKEELGKVFVNMVKALKQEGVIYVSFKFGDFEGMRNGRYFTDLTEDTIEDIFDQLPVRIHAEIIDHWRTKDVRVGREAQIWLNYLIRSEKGLYG